jgi:hypothetical protein
MSSLPLGGVASFCSSAADQCWGRGSSAITSTNQAACGGTAQAGSAADHDDSIRPLLQPYQRGSSATGNNCGVGGPPRTRCEPPVPSALCGRWIRPKEPASRPADRRLHASLAVVVANCGR